MIRNPIVAASIDLSKELLTQNPDDTKVNEILSLKNSFIKNPNEIKTPAFEDLKQLAIHGTDEERAASIHTIWLFEFHLDRILMPNVIDIFLDSLRDPSYLVRDNASFYIASFISNDNLPDSIMSHILKNKNVLADLKNIIDFGLETNPQIGFEQGGASDFAASIYSAIIKKLNLE